MSSFNNIISFDIPLIKPNPIKGYKGHSPNSPPFFSLLSATMASSFDVEVDGDDDDGDDDDGEGDDVDTDVDSNGRLEKYRFELKLIDDEYLFAKFMEIGTMGLK